jgi:predicted trehalose synthase
VGRDLAQAFGTGNVAAAEIVARIGDRLRGAAREPLLPALSARVGRAAGVGRVPVQRVHGDLHLAQALFSGGR